MSNYPPLKALSFFNEVAKTKHFAKAAENLSVTPGAVSQQVKVLETYFGCQLLERNNKAVRLTSHGELFWHKIKVAFELIEEAAENLKPTNSSSIQIKMVGTLAAHWLIPKIHQLYAMLPNIDVHILPAVDDANINDFSSADLAIICTNQKPLGAHSHKLWVDELVLVASDHQDTNHVQDWFDQQIAIEVDQPLRQQDWDLFLKGNQLQQTKKRVRVANTLQGIEAVRSGAGVLVTHYVFVESYILSGELKMIGEPVLNGQSYYLVENYILSYKSSIKEVTKWILNQAM